ncbi:helix-hairpin-helix domain-containing protein [Amycolatopsis sp. 195334CR]|uniref:ComEA family DNA-binding protein n=1 Tax=Amycolatopsis sp. 195334CR TaxID=2814588 RepID=UPI0027DD5CF5|nr:helix-hairpin-helix domain-containing protein [Amycolatopsis sp. 195334CR]
MTERRLGLIEFGKALNDSVSVRGLGELPGGQVSAGRATRGARARLIRNERVLADNLRLGITVRKKFFSSEVEPVTEVGFLKDVFVVVGRRDLGNGDALELYTDEEAPPDTSRQTGMAQVHASYFDEITGVSVQVHQRNGVLREGALVGLLRGGRGGGQPMRVLRLFGPAGPVLELPAGQPGTVLLGFQCEVQPMSGDALVRFDEPEREYLEHREGWAVAHGVSHLPDGTVVAAVEVPEAQKANRLSVGSMVRVLRPAGTTFNERSTVAATGARITSLAKENLVVPVVSGSGVCTVGLSHIDLREGDTVEAYIPAPGSGGGGGMTGPQHLAPPPTPAGGHPGAPFAQGPPTAQGGPAAQGTPFAQGPPTGQGLPTAPGHPSAPGHPTAPGPLAAQGAQTAQSAQTAQAPLTDLNTAPPPELARLPGMTPPRVAKTIELRQRQGGFADVEAFGVAIGLQPHEIVRLRAKATTSRIQHHNTGVRQLDI